MFLWDLDDNSSVHTTFTVHTLPQCSLYTTENECNDAHDCWWQDDNDNYCDNPDDCACSILWANDHTPKFYPRYLSLWVGDTVEWVNDEGFHDVLITSGPYDFGLDPCTGPCNIGSHTFTTPGVYEYLLYRLAHLHNRILWRLP